MRKKIFCVFTVVFLIAVLSCVSAFAAEYPSDLPPVPSAVTDVTDHYVVFTDLDGITFLYYVDRAEVCYHRLSNRQSAIRFGGSLNGQYLGMFRYGAFKLVDGEWQSYSTYNIGSELGFYISVVNFSTFDIFSEDGSLYYGSYLPEPDSDPLSDIFYQMPGAMQFDGESDYFLTGCRPFDQARELTFVVSFTADSQVGGSGQPVMVTDENGAYFKIRDNSGSFWALEGNGRVSETLETDTDGSWIHSWDNTSVIVAVYKDGVFDFGKYYLADSAAIYDISKNASTAAFEPATAQMILGCSDPWSGSGWWKGTIHNFTVYNGAATAEEVSSLIQNELDNMPSFFGDLGKAGSAVLSWSGAVAETIAGEPVLLLTVGVFILGAAIAIFRRLLGRD